MPDAPSAALGTWRDHPSLELTAGEVGATFVPSMGMVGVSLRWRGDELLDLRGGLDAWRRGHTMGLPLLHPWANRLGGSCYRVGPTEVDLDRASRDGALIPRDPGGLPMHGTLVGPFAWEVDDVSSGGESASASTRFAFDATKGPVFEAFPFPHDLVIETVVRARGLSVTTRVRPTGAVAVPISFGWHPWFRLPGVAREDLELVLPERQHLILDERMLPTGEVVDEPAERLSLHGRTFDDHFELGGSVMSVRGPRHVVTLAVDDGYPFAQVYAPASSAVVCLEPMTARVNALVDGSTSMASPRSEVAASFTISVDGA